MTDKERITVAEAGRRGGSITRDRYGRDFYQKIGAEGGRRTAELYADLLKEFGKRGGRPRRPTLDESMGERDHQKGGLRLAHGLFPPPEL
jgi:general stress protein YciG